MTKNVDLLNLLRTFVFWFPLPRIGGEGQGEGGFRESIGLRR
jgi:hypothetical protein